MTAEMLCDRIIRVVKNGRITGYLERYRSGHNEAVLKTVCPQGRVGSNPTLSAYRELCLCRVLFVLTGSKLPVPIDANVDSCEQGED